MTTPDSWTELFGVLSERFPLSFADIGELTILQFAAHLRYLGQHPVPFVMMVSPA